MDNFKGDDWDLQIPDSLTNRWPGRKSWKKYLIKKLYRHQTSIKAGTLKSLNESPHQDIFQKAIQTLKTRKPIYPEPNSMLREWLQLSLAKFKCIFPFTANDWFYLKAQSKLSTELDIKRFIRSQRFMRAAIKLFTTKRERRLLRMQSKQNVLRVNDEDKHQLKIKLKDQSLLDL
jgi:hypothetical protein